MQGTREERARFAAAIGKVALLTTKNEKPDSTILKLYWTALKPYNIETIEEVADRLIAVETSLISVPPPGRWRAVADELYELRPAEAMRPKGRKDCWACEGTGWRPADQFSPDRSRRGVVACECRSGELPPHGIDPSLLMAPLPEGVDPLPLDGERPPVPGETELARRRREWGNQILTCYCCKQPYRRGVGWKCCSAPSGMNHARWTGLWHRHCEGTDQHRCPRHCPHPESERNIVTPPQPVWGPPIPMPAEDEHIHDWAVRTGLRDADAPGPDATQKALEDALGDSEWPEDEHEDGETAVDRGGVDLRGAEPPWDGGTEDRGSAGHFVRGRKSQGHRREPANGD